MCVELASLGARCSLDVFFPGRQEGESSFPAGEEWKIPGSPVHNEQRWDISLTPIVPHNDPWSESCGICNAAHTVVSPVTFL